MSPEKSRYRVAVESVGQNRRRQPCPPHGRHFALVKQDSPQVPPIRKKQAPSCLAQDQQIVFPDFEQIRLGTEPTRHSKMQAQPGRSALAETKEHLFAAGLRIEEYFTSKRLLKMRNYDPAKDAVPWPWNNYFQDLLPDASTPDTPALFDFGQFGHSRMMS